MKIFFFLWRNKRITKTNTLLTHQFVLIHLCTCREDKVKQRYFSYHLLSIIVPCMVQKHHQTDSIIHKRETEMMKANKHVLNIHNWKEKILIHWYHWFRSTTTTATITNHLSSPTTDTLKLTKSSKIRHDHKLRLKTPWS